jgi:M3 family oligoendopeptidase
MKFNEFKYERLDFDKSTKEFAQLLEKLERCDNSTDFKKVFQQLNVYRAHLTTMVSLAQVRHSIDTSDKFYDAENDYWNEKLPLYASYENKLSKIALRCKFKEELYDYIPETYFKLAECSEKSFDEKIIPLLQEENRLTSEYGKLKASAKIDFEGEILNLSQIAAKALDDNRDKRKKAYDAKINFYEKNEAEFDRIFDELVKVRDKMAKSLGFKNYIELGYLRMNRLDYDQEMVANYRKQIINDIVPTVTKLREKQAKRLGLTSLKYYDVPYKFATGNPKPKGTPEDLVNAAVEMYHDMSPETGEFIDLMYNSELWDLKSKPNKEMGGYCTTFPDYKAPFIFSNFNGTSGDVDVLTHEAGHAFQAYQSRDIETIDCQGPTLESCEIHSMSMEFFAYKYMEKFFKEDTQKYYYLHLAGTLEFLPYGVLVDHFQHVIYENPDMSIEQRKKAYHDLEILYLPNNDYGDNKLLNKGCWWYQQGHIFQVPFYYIDYTLAQVCALQFWVRMINEDKTYWTDYLNLCKLGGTKSFLQLVKVSNLISPFKDGCLKDVKDKANEYFESVDDTRL